MTETTELVRATGLGIERGHDSAAQSPGDLATAVFGCLDDGISPIEIVARFAVAPEQMEELWRTWARLRGHVLVLPETIARCIACSSTVWWVAQFQGDGVFSAARSERLSAPQSAL